MIAQTIQRGYSYVKHVLLRDPIPIKHVYVDSSLIELSCKRNMIKTGMVVVEPGISDKYFIATKFVRTNFKSNIEVVGIKTAYTIFGQNAIYFTDCQDTVRRKHKVFQIPIELKFMYRWDPKMILADSIADGGIYNCVNLSKYSWGIAIKRQSGHMFRFNIAIYQNGELITFDKGIRLHSLNSLKKTKYQMIPHHIWEPFDNHVNDNPPVYKFILYCL